MRKPVSRRQFLAGSVAALATVSGCLGGSDAGDDSEPALQLSLSHVGGSLRERYVVDLAETRLAWDQAAFEATVDGSTYTTQHRRPFYSTSEDPKYVERDGTYYRLGSVVVDEVAERHPVVRLVEAQTDDADSVPAEQLPQMDQRAVEIAHMATRARGNEGGVPWDLVERGGYVYRQEDATADSQLLSDEGPTHVTYRDTRYAVEVTEELFHEPVYRATVEQVASSPGQMERVLRAKFLDARINREELSRDAQDVLQTARGDRYSETHPFSSGFRVVLKALQRRAYLDGDIENDAVDSDYGSGTILYEGEYFDFRVRLDSENSSAR